VLGNSPKQIGSGENAVALKQSVADEQFSLSLRERAGVRGKSAV
jgi:hypothetical protein